MTPESRALLTTSHVEGTNFCQYRQFVLQSCDPKTILVDTPYIQSASISPDKYREEAVVSLYIRIWSFFTKVTAMLMSHILRGL